MNGDSVCMAKFKFEGIEKYTESLEKIGLKNAVGILKYAVYPGAAVVADAIRAEIEAKHSRNGDLAKSLTLAVIRNDNGYVNTKITFAGYDRNGTPNAIKAAALESGTSDDRQSATHFISKTTKSVTDRAISEMSKALDEKIEQIMEG